MDDIKPCRTSFPTEYPIQKESIVILMTINLVITISNILTNAFLIYALEKTGQTKTLSNKLIAILSISDCSAGVLVQPLVLAILGMKYSGTVSCNIEFISQALSFLLHHFSGVMLAIIALDRFVHIKYANTYSSIMSKSMAFRLVLLNGIIAVAVAVSSYIASAQHMYRIFDFTLSVIDALVILFIWFNYAIIFYSIRKKMKSIRRKDSHGQERLHTNVRADAVLATTIIMIMTSQAVCYFPYFLSSFIWAFSGEGQLGTHAYAVASFKWWTLLLVHSSTAINAMIFIFRNRMIKRKYFKRVITSADSSIVQTET